MKDVPEIAPEIRGLLEEIVSNPRSAIRLAPRRALSSWFDSGEMIRATDVSRNKAARHLVAAHREELATLLREASWISYWKAPVLAHRPEENGRLYQPTQREPNWCRRAEREVAAASDWPNEVGLLRLCLVGIKPQQGLALAKASLSLVPSDSTRYYVALSVPWSAPRSAIAILSRLVHSAHYLHTRKNALLSLAARTCSLGLLSQASDYYKQYSAMEPQSPCGRICSFNLSCFLGDENAARTEAAELDKVAKSDDPLVIEVCDILREWSKTRSKKETILAREIGTMLRGRVPAVAEAVCRSFQS